jgi:hypothetical protein
LQLTEYVLGGHPRKYKGEEYVHIRADLSSFQTYSSSDHAKLVRQVLQFFAGISIPAECAVFSLNILTFLLTYSSQFFLFIYTSINALRKAGVGNLFFQ